MSWLHRHWLFPVALFPVAIASMLVACGEKVIVDASGAVGGGGGSATTTESVGAGGSATTTTSVGAGGDCSALQDVFVDKLAVALACNPALAVPQCNGSVTTVDICGCTLVANDSSAEAAESATEAFNTWLSAGCGPFNCLHCPPGPDTPWYCDPATSRCAPAFE